MKTNTDTNGRPQGARITGQVLLRAVPLAVALAAVGIPVVSWAQVVPDAAAGTHQPKMDSAANGVPVVDIVAPNAAGVSHNKYRRFDVDQRGLILNNSGSISRTQLGGYIAGNDNLKNGEASLILNEVTSGLPSSLRGYVEVGGKAAPVVIANPYGITCDGCGIINSQRFTLTTGTPVFGGSGSLDAFHVTGGSIAIGSGGLDTAAVDRTDLIARAVQVNGQIWAKDLSVIAGSNDAGYTDASVRAGQATGARTGVAIDVAALGGMYAEKIRLVGTEAGVGVVSSGVIAAQAGDLTLSSAGEVRLTGKTVAMNRLGLDAAGPVTLDGTLGTQTGDVLLTTQGALALHGSVIAANALSMRAYGDIDQSGRLNAGSGLTLATSGALRNSGVVYTGQAFDISTGTGLRNDGIIYAAGGGRASAGGALETTATSTLHAGNALSVDAGSVSSLGVIDAGGALALASRGDTTLDGAVQAGGDLSLQGAGVLANRASVVSGGRLDAQAASIGNESTGVLSATGALAVTTAGALANQGSLYAGSDISLTAAALTQAATARIYGGGNVQALISGDTINGGSLVGGNGLSLTTQGLVSTGELGTRQGDAALTSAGDMTLGGNTVIAGALRARSGGNLQQTGQLTAGSLDVDAVALSNTGSIYGRGDASVHTSNTLANSGSLYGDGSLMLNADGSVVNTGTLHAGNDVGVQARTIDSGKQIDAGRDMRLSADAIHTAGAVQAGRDLSLTTGGTLDNDGQVVAGRDIGVNAATLTNTGALSATHDLALSITGDVANNGRLYAGHALTVDANTVSLGASAAATGADTATLTLRGDLHNAGSLVAGTALNVTAAGLDSSGSLGSTLGTVGVTSTQGDVRLTGTTSGAGALIARSAQNLVVDGTLSGASLDMGAAGSMALAGSIYAAGTSAFNAMQSLTSTGTVYTDGDLSFHAGTTLDASGTIHSGTNLSASAGTLTSHGVLDAGQDLSLQAGTTTLGGTLQAGRDLALNATTTLTNGAQAIAGRDVALGAATIVNTGAVSATRALAVTGSGDLTNDGSLYAGANLSLRTNGLGQGANGQISAAQAIDLVLAGAFSSAGRLVAGQGLTVTAASLASTGQLGTLAGDVALTTTQGNLTLGGTTVSAGGLKVTSAGDVAQTSSLSAKTLTLDASGAVQLSGSTYSDADATLKAGTNLTVDGTLSSATQATLSATQGLAVGAAGVMHAGGDLQIHAASIASQGTLDAGNDAILNAGSIDLSGRVQAARDARLSGDTMRNASTLVAARDVMLGSTHAANLANGAISAQRNLAVTVAQDVVNDGILYAGQLFTLDASSFAQGTQAQATGNTGLTITLNGALDSAGSIVGGNGVTIGAGSLRSTGQLGTTQGDVNLTTTQGDLALAGTTVAAGNLHATSAGALAQTGSLSATAVDLSSAADLTLTGDTSSHAGMTLGTATALHNNGTVYAGKSLGVHAGGGFDNSGAVGAQEAVTLDIGGVFTQTASATLQGNGPVSVVAGSIDSKGVLASAQDLQLTGHGNVALAGVTQAGGMLRVDADGDMTNAGKLASGSAMTLTGTNIANAATGSLSTGDTLALAARGTLDNQGTIYAGKALTLGASTFNQGAAAQTYGADTLAIDVAGALQNAGNLVAAKGMDVRAGSVATTGMLGTQQGDIAILSRQGDLALGGTVSSAGRLDASTSAALHQSGQLAATSLSLTATGDLTTSGDIVVQDAALKSGGILSQNGTLGANGITLDATTVNNSGRTLSSGDLTVRAQTIGVDGILGAGVKQDGSLGTSGTLHTLAGKTLTAHGSLLAGGVLDVQADALDLSNGTQRAGSDATLLARVGDIDHTGGDLAIGGVLTAQTSGKLINRGANGHTARMQAGQLSLTTGSLDNGAGQLLQTGTATTSIKTTGVLDNTGGTIATNAAGLALRGTRLVNTDGNVQVAGTGLLDINVSQDVDNRQGTLTTNGTTQVVAGGGIANDGGLINAHGDTSLSGASLSNTANGAISGSTLDVTVTGAVNNGGGLLQATSGATHVDAGSLTNAGGTVQAANGAVNLGITSTLDNGGGTIAAGAAAQLNAASLSNVSGVISGGTLGLQVGDAVNNSSGLLQSRGNLDLRTVNGLTNNAGRIESNGATTLNAGSLANIGGRIANASAQVTQVATGGAIDNRGGTLGGQGDVNLTASSIGNSQAGTLVAAGNMTLSTGQLDNSNGTAYAGNTFTFNNGGATVYNAGGKITAGRQLNLSLLTLENSGGTVQAGIDGVGGVGNVVLDIRNLVGQGTIVANNTLGMHLVGDYIQAAGSSIKANGGFNLAVDGQFVNNGSIQAVQGLSISAANITNSAGALLNSANTQLTTGGTITNAGSIQGDTVGLHAGTVNNTGTIMGGDVTVQAGTVINGADMGAQTGNAAYQSGTIAATRNVDIYTNYLLNRDAQVFSLGNINIAGAGRNGQGLFDTRAGQVDNYSGSIQAQGSILLAANQINNVRRVLQTDSHTLTQAEYDASEPLPIADYKHNINKVQEYETWTEYHTISQTTVVAASAQSQIVAGGNISLYGSVTNNTSTIAAAGFLAVNQAGAGGGTGMIAGNENVANQSLALGRTIQSVAVTHHIGCGWEPDLCQPTQEQESYTRRPDTDPSHYIHDNYNALPTVMSGSQGVSIGGVNVSNGGVTGDGRSVSNARLDPNAQVIGLSTANKGGAQAGGGIAIGAQVDPATGHAPQVLGGAGQPLAGVTLPTGGIYSVRAAGAGQSVAVDGGSASAPLAGVSGGGSTVTVDGPTGDNLVRSTGGGQRVGVDGVDAGVLSATAGGASARAVGSMGNAYLTALLGHAPSSNYLIETNARFADYSQFISSDYLLDHLGVDPSRTMMRLGDGFYEQQLVTQQVTQLTGRAYLSDYSSGLAEYQALMNNASNVSKAMNLSVGVALTADQVSSLTQDIVWLVQQNVQGHDVLVPVVYLAGGSLGLTAQGAVIAGKDVTIDASGTLANDGLIRGQNSAVLSAQNLLNSGRISSDGLTALSATKDIVNTNGRIDGAGVALVAGGDIRSENLTGIGARGMEGSSIVATQGLQVSAGHDLSLNSTAVSSGGNALLTAGHDLSLSGNGVSAGGNLTLMAGNNLSLASTVTTDTPYRWSSVTTTHADGIGLSAGNNLSLVAGNDLSLSGSKLTAGGDAMLQAGHDLTLGAVQTGNRWNTQTLGTQIDAGGSLGLSAGHDLTAQAATLRSGADMALLAGHDLSLTATTDGSANHVTHQVSTLDAGGNLSIAAGNDALLQGTQLTAGKTVGLQAGNDLTLSAVTDSTSQTSSWKEGKKHITQSTTDETVRGVDVNAGAGVQMVAGHDLTLQAAGVKTAGDIALGAGHDLSLTTADETHTVVTDTKKKKSGLFSSKTTITHDTSEQTLVKGATLVGDNIHLMAGNDLTAEGAAVKATGDIALAAGHDVNLLASEDTYNETHDKTVKKSGFVINRGLAPVQQGKKTVTNDETAQHVATGTLLSGDSISVAAGHDVLGEGAKIAGTHDVTIAAGNDLHLTTAVDRYSDSHDKSVTTTGYSRSGFNEVYGKVKDSRSEETQQVTHTGSVVGSSDGRVNLAAGGDLHLTGTDVISKAGTSIVGKNVTIDADTDTLDTRQSQKHSEGGISGGLGGGLYDLALDVRSSAMHAGRTDDDRLKALYAAKVAYDVKDGVNAVSQMGSITDAKSAAGATGINIQVGIGGSSSSSKTTTHDGSSYGSHIASGGTITIGATGGDLTIVGAKVTGNNVALAATRDINLLSQVEDHSLKNDSKNSSGGVGVSFGSDGFGIYASASIGSGKAHGNGQTHAETTINADDRLTIISGNDTTIQGAQLKGQQVVANVGNNLTIRSEQDTDDFASKTMQAGGKVMVGLTQSGFVSGSAYFAQSKVDSHYSSVNEVSGIQAGSGGFQLDVGGNTHLVGGKIASEADASKNWLSTGTLTYEDLHNESKYKASQISFSGGSTVASNVAGAIGTAISAATPQHGNASSDTRSGIAEGTIVVRNDPGKDLSGLDRKPTLENEALKNTYDANKVADRQELTALAGYVGMRGVGDISLWMAKNAKTDDERAAWMDGGANKVILHGVVGAAMASLGGGEALGGALGGASGEAVSHVMQQYLYDHNVQPGSAEWNTYMQLGSAIVGGAVGGGNGANAALSGDLYNREIHTEERERIRLLANGDKAEEDRLLAAACSMARCYAQYPEGSADYVKYKAMADQGQLMAPEIDLLSKQTATDYVFGLGSVTTQSRDLFKYTKEDAGNDSSAVSWKNAQVGVRLGGAAQWLMGTASAAGSIPVASTCETGVGCAAALYLWTTGWDNAAAGYQTMVNGRQSETIGSQALQKLGMSPAAAEFTYGVTQLAPVAVEAVLINKAINVQSEANNLARLTYANDPFLTNGVKIDTAARSSAEYQAVLDVYVKSGVNVVDATVYTDTLVASGKKLPVAMNVDSSTELIKLVPKSVIGGDAVSQFSPFFVTRTEFDRLSKLSPRELADNLGIPAEQAIRGSQLGFDVYSMQPVVGAKPKIFTSDIAPVSQGEFQANGGAQQVLVPDRSKWSDPNLNKIGEIRGYRQ